MSKQNSMHTLFILIILQDINMVNMLGLTVQCEHDTKLITARSTFCHQQFFKLLTPSLLRLNQYSSIQTRMMELQLWLYNALSLNIVNKAHLFCLFFSDTF